MSRPQIALVAREIRPFGGGIGTYVAELARFLSRDADVSVFVSAARRDEMEEASVRRQTMLDGSVNLVFVPDSGDPGSYYGELHRYSARVLRALKREYGTRGPDLIEFQDYLGEGAVTLQARVTRDRFLAETPVTVRLNTSAEMCSVLDGYIDISDAARHIFALERFSLRFADRLLYGGGDVYGLYRRFYGAGALAPGQLVRQPLGPDGPIAPADDVAPPTDGPLRLLYLGRLERRKGVADLVRAMSVLTEDVSLTMVGGDTQTAPLGTWMRPLLEQAFDPDRPFWGGGAARIDLVDHVEPAEIPALIDRHHAVVIPSIWECWPAVGLETLAHNRPILATPVGGLQEMVQPRSGWLLGPERDANALADGIEALARDRMQITDLVEARGPRAVHEELCEPERLREFYLQTAPRRATRSSGARWTPPRPLVSIVIPYYRMSSYVQDTLDSVLAQTHPELEIVIVDDGSFELKDRIIAGLSGRHNVRVAVQPNSGLGAARNFGIKLSRGRYVGLLDADNLYEPRFVERAVEVLETDPEISYVSSWSRFIDEHGLPLGGPAAGYQPLGNFSELLKRENVAGDAAALVRRSIFDRGYWFSEELTSYEDWDFYYRLHAAGIFGHCIPERLMRYRVREGSMVREVGLQETLRLSGELLSSRLASEVAWR